MKINYDELDYYQFLNEEGFEAEIVNEEIVGKASERVTEDILYKKFDLVGPAGKVRFETERWGTYLVAGFVVMIILLAFILVWTWLRRIPPLPNLSAPNADKMIENYKKVREIGTDDVTKIFDGIIAKVFAPILGVAIGYLFGKRQEGKGSDPS